MNHLKEFGIFLLYMAGLVALAAWVVVFVVQTLSTIENIRISSKQEVCMDYIHLDYVVPAKPLVCWLASPVK